MATSPTTSRSTPSPDSEPGSEHSGRTGRSELTGRSSADRDTRVTVVEAVPWSMLERKFTEEWGRPRGKVMPEHLEIVGPTGSGKSLFLVKILKERVRRRASSVIYIATKNQDATIKSLGWEIADSWSEVVKHDQVIFWPRTSAKGTARKRFQAGKVQELLDNLWEPDANTVVVWDEWAYAEALDAELKATMQMYLREGRSHGITCVMGKQRVQGTQRDMHSESDWKIGFKMNDDEDNERLAQLFGSRKKYLPVIDSLDRSRFEFLIQSKLTGVTFISWVDHPISLSRNNGKANTSTPVNGTNAHSNSADRKSGYRPH